MKLLPEEVQFKPARILKHCVAQNYVIAEMACVVVNPDGYVAPDLTAIKQVRIELTLNKSMTNELEHPVYQTAACPAGPKVFIYLDVARIVEADTGKNLTAFVYPLADLSPSTFSPEGTNRVPQLPYLLFENTKPKVKPSGFNWL